jgi:hypothetical protein
MNVLWILKKKYNRDIKVDFTCKCGNTHNKTIEIIELFL